MKKIIILSGLLVLLFTSCYHNDEPVYDPIANFTVDYNLVIPYEAVNFSNHSVDAESFQWDFGDGSVSNEINPSHSYAQEGDYTVRLTAINHNNADYSTIVITVQETTLEVTVREWTTGDLIPGTEVTLYSTYLDWNYFENPVISGTADQYGVVVFKGLKNISYYVDARDSYTGATNDYFLDPNDYDNTVGFIRTLPLEYAAYNTFEVSVDYPEFMPKKAELTSKSDKKTRSTNFTSMNRKFGDKPPYMLKK